MIWIEFEGFEYFKEHGWDATIDRIAEKGQEVVENYAKAAGIQR